MNPSQEKINLIFDEYSRMIKPAMTEILDVYVDEKYREIVKYQIFTGGKRLRPALAFIACQLLGGKANDAIYPAAGLEILHNYSLIVDDIIDNSTLRRNKPTVWYKFGKSIASCVSVDYAAAIFEAANKSKKPLEISETFAKTLKIIFNGEILDILFERAGRSKEPYIAKNRYGKITEKDFFDMCGKKTAILFQSCCEVGGILADASQKELEALKNYGFNLGIAFQIQDDILDVFGDEKSFGKKIGKDIMERKGGNIIVMLALAKLPKKDGDKIISIMEKNRVKAGEVNEIMNLISKTYSKQEADELKKKFIKKAVESLDLLPKNKWNNIMKEITDFIITREK